MLDLLNKKNSDFKIYSVEDSEFATFGRIINNIDATEIIEVAKTIESPAEGSAYEPSTAAFESLKIAEIIKNECFGTLPTQVGYCWGHNNFLNGTEWHYSSEINIAVTPLVLILGHVWDIKEGKIASSDFKAFYLPAGTVVEVYATTLHFCPCEVEKEGFGCVVGLPTGTNTPHDNEVESPVIFRRNKWLLAHEANEGLISKGVVSGITGINYEIKY